MKTSRTLAYLVPVGLGVAACSSSDAKSVNASPPYESATAAAAGIIDVAPNSQISLSLRGGLGPIVESQTITKAMVTLAGVELANEADRAVALLDGPVSVDLLAFQNDLDELVAARSIEADRYKELRFRLSSAWIETVDDQQVRRIFASDLGSARRLDVQGIDGDGFVRVALPDGGIRVRGASSIVMHLSLAESLSAQSADNWALEPRIWAASADALSSLEVKYDATRDGASSLARGYKVMLLDAGLRPVGAADLARMSATTASATFRFLESFQGPFVAVLLPPSGVALRTSVAVPVDVSVGVRAEAHVRVTALREAERQGDVVTVDARTGDDAAVIERNASGAVMGRRTRQVGSIEDVAPSTGPSAPVRHGQRAMPQAPPPALPGLPAPGPRHGKWPPWGANDGARPFGPMRPHGVER